MTGPTRVGTRDPSGYREEMLPPPIRPALNSRHRFLRACNGERVDCPPVWMMRQAGRVLPEYRKLKERHSFLELVQTPELAAEVTLQPVRRFGFDAAIIFSDILVVPEAMGQAYHFRDTGGVQMEFAIRSENDIRNLRADQIVERLHYVAGAIRLVKRALNGGAALLGFAGAPWTLANFMLDGGSAREHTRALALFREQRSLFETLCEKISEAVVTFLCMQVGAGVDAIQIFDSLAGLIPPADYKAASGCWIREILSALADRVPVILFSRGVHDWSALTDTGARGISVDSSVRLGKLRRQLPPGIVIQGNLDPARLVHDTPGLIRLETLRLLAEMRGRPGYIFNLGHGVPPAARLENIQQVIDTIRSSP